MEAAFPGLNSLVAAQQQVSWRLGGAGRLDLRPAGVTGTPGVLLFLVSLYASGRVRSPLPGGGAGGQERAVLRRCTDRRPKEAGLDPQDTG